MLSPDASLIDVAYAVCTRIETHGERAVLCGGSAVTFYLPDRYQSLDVDFVLSFGARRKNVDAALASLGYRRRDDHYAHEGLSFTIDFPKGPLAVGIDEITRYRTVHRNDEFLHVLEPFDVIRDRFMHFWSWGDASARALAVAVARQYRDEIDLTRLRDWGTREMASDPSYDRAAFDRFMSEIARG